MSLDCLHFRKSKTIIWVSPLHVTLLKQADIQDLLLFDDAMLYAIDEQLQRVGQLCNASRWQAACPCRPRTSIVRRQRQSARRGCRDRLAHADRARRLSSTRQTGRSHAADVRLCTVLMRCTFLRAHATPCMPFCPQFLRPRLQFVEDTTGRCVIAFTRALKTVEN